MSATNRPIIPILAMYRSPNASQPTSSEEVTPRVVPPPKTDITTPAIIARTPFSEERSELHASYLMKKRISADNSSNSSDKDPEMPSTMTDSSVRSDILSDLSKCRMSDSRLTQSDFGSEKVALKT